MDRRTFCASALAGLAGAPVGLARAQRRRPLICSFSLEHGWRHERRQYVTRRAAADDRSGVPQVVARIERELGIDGGFTVLITEDEDNAFATIAGGQKVLGVDVDFLSNLNRRVGTQWSAIQVIAHEVGHHIAGFGSDPHQAELNADYWSGQALQRLGSARDSATAAILAIGSEVDTSSHPNKRRRAAVIARGWDDADRDFIDRRFCISC